MSRDHSAPRWALATGAAMRGIPAVRGRARIAGPLHRIFGCTGWSADVHVQGFRMRVSLDDLIGRSIFLDGVWERQNTAAVRRLIRPGDWIFDVGANAGYFSLLFSQLVGPSGRIYAFEPVPATADRLEANLAANPELRARIEVVKVALSSEEGAAIMEVAGGDNTGASHVLGMSGSTPEQHATAAEVRCRTGDGVWTELGRPRIGLLKMDIEGHELFALKGFPSMLRESPDLVVLMEVRDRALRKTGGSTAALFELMHGHGFSSYDYHSDGEAFVRNDAPRDGELVVFSKRPL